jgi:hypothetical protein
MSKCRDVKIHQLIQPQTNTRNPTRQRGLRVSRGARAKRVRDALGAQRSVLVFEQPEPSPAPLRSRGF